MDRVKLTFADIAMFLDSRNVKKVCHACGNEHLAIDQDIYSHEPSVFTLLKEENSLANSEVIFPLVTVICPNCSHIMQYSRMMIENWRKQNGF